MKSFIPAFVLLALTPSCVAGTKFSAEDVSKLNLCTSTRDEAVKLFGDPYNVGVEGGMSTLTWSYASVSKGERLQIAVGPDGKIIDIALNPSMGYKSTDQCKKKEADPAAPAEPKATE